MGDCMPKEQYEHIRKIQLDCLKLTNMTTDEAWNFGFHCWQLGYIKQDEDQVINDWIPVEERLPDDGRYILLSFENLSTPEIGRYEEDEEGGAFYIGDEEETCVSLGLFVNAWQELPTPYKKAGGVDERD